jgi:hypothetical protein
LPAGTDVAGAAAGVGTAPGAATSSPSLTRMCRPARRETLETVAQGGRRAGDAAVRARVEVEDQVVEGRAGPEAWQLPGFRTSSGWAADGRADNLGESCEKKLQIFRFTLRT